MFYLWGANGNCVILLLVFRDVQASSILLDDKFEVRLGSLSEAHAQEGDGNQNVITRFLKKPQ